MSQLHVEASDIIDARPEAIYAVISDYQVGHPAIVPKPYFTGVTVEKGGRGAGTVIRVAMKVMGVEKVYHQIVSEPEPGRVLVEADEAAGVTTTFTVDPLEGGQQSRVNIATDMRLSPGFTGLVERLINPPFMRYLYRKELRQLADYVRSNTAVPVN